VKKLAVVAALVLSLAPVPLQAATKGVKVRDNSFKPKSIAVRVGGAVRWTRAADSFGDHNVHGERNLFFSGAPTTGKIDFRVPFSAGSFSYRCDLHAGIGMTGFVRVPPTVAAAPTGLNFTVRWANGITRTGGKYDIAYKIGTGKWRTWKKNTTAKWSVFGKKHKPVTVVNGKKYSFRARSQNKKGASHWSPVRSFRP
jgi:plastocyanin